MCGYAAQQGSTVFPPIDCFTSSWGHPTWTTFIDLRLCSNRQRHVVCFKHGSYDGFRVKTPKTISGIIQHWVYLYPCTRSVYSRLHKDELVGWYLGRRGMFPFFFFSTCTLEGMLLLAVCLGHSVASDLRSIRQNLFPGSSLCCTQTSADVVFFIAYATC